MTVRRHDRFGPYFQEFFFRSRCSRIVNRKVKLVIENGIVIRVVAFQINSERRGSDDGRRHGWLLHSVQCD